MKKMTKVVVWCLGLLVGLPTAIIALVIGWSFILVNSDLFLSNIPDPPSDEMKKTLADQRIYYTEGYTLYETVGYQKRANIVKAANRLDAYYTYYWFPSLSPNSEFLAFYRVYDKCEYLAVDLILMDTKTRSQKIIYSAKDSEGFRDFQFTRGYCASSHSRNTNPSASDYTIGWSEDSQQLLFNFADNHYTYDIVNNNLVDQPGIITLQGNTSTICIRDYHGCYAGDQIRFKFERAHYLNPRWSWNVVRYIKGTDTTTGEEFRLTVLERDAILFE